MAQIKTPIIARSTFDNLVEAISDEGKFANLDRTMFVLLTDDEHKDMFAFVTPDRIIHLIVGNNEEEQSAIASLQERLDGVDSQLEVVVGNISDLQTSTVDLSDRIDQLSERATTAEDEIGLLRSDLEMVDGTVQDLAAGQIALNETVTAMKETDQEIQEALTQVYTKNEVDEKLDGYYDKSDIDSQVSSINSSISSLSGSIDAVDAKFDNVYTKDEVDQQLTDTLDNYYTKDAVDEEISNKTGDIGEITIQQYVSNETAAALNEAKEYANNAIQLTIV